MYKNINYCIIKNIPNSDSKNSRNFFFPKKKFKKTLDLENPC